MNIKKIFFKVAKKNALALLFATLMAGLAIAISMAVPFVIQSAIDEGIGKGNIELLGRLSLLLVGIVSVGYIFELINIYIFAKVAKQFTREVFSKIIKHLCLKSNKFFIDQNSGEINERINEAWELEDIFSPEFFSSIYALPMLLVATIILVNTSIEITIITFVGIIISVALLGLNNYYIGKHMQKVLDKKVNVTSKIQEIILSVFEIRSNSASKMFTNKTDKAIDDKCKTSLKFSMGITFFMRSSSLVSALLSIFLLYFSGLNIIGGSLTIGTYFLIVSYVEKITEPFMQLTSMVVTMKPLLITTKRIEENFALNEKDFCENGVRDQRITSVTLDNINFTYEGSQEATIRDFNLTAMRGDIVLIKGANGSGKSTLLNLICGELKPDSGHILFDNDRKFPQDCLTLARQRPFIFNLSLRDNIILAQDYSQELYQDILTYFRFSDYFDDKTLNNEVIIQENGKDLSGGQLKLIAIARCLYRSRSIIILDEIISNLDSDLKKIVVDYIQEMRHKHIFILVEHTNEFEDLATISINLDNREKVQC